MLQIENDQLIFKVHWFILPLFLKLLSKYRTKIAVKRYNSINFVRIFQVAVYTSLFKKTILKYSIKHKFRKKETQVLGKW